MVGVVVLGGLIILGWMMLQFGAQFATPFAPPTIPVRFSTSRADGISNGSAVSYRGVMVGHVEDVSRAPDGLTVFIDATLDKDPPLPANMKAIIRVQGLVGGGASIVLELDSPQPQGQMAPNQNIPTQFVGLDILPDEFTALVTELRLTVKQLRDSNVIPHIDEQVLRVGKLIDSAEQVIADPQLREDLKSSLASLKQTTDKADRIATNIEKFSGELPKISSGATDLIADARTTVQTTQGEIQKISQQVNDRLVQVSSTLDKIQSITTKVDQGQGTAGLLVNDPKLYQSLVDSSRELNSTISDLHRLIQQWEQEGVSLKLK